MDSSLASARAVPRHWRHVLVTFLRRYGGTRSSPAKILVATIMLSLATFWRYSSSSHLQRWLTQMWRKVHPAQACSVSTIPGASSAMMEEHARQASQPSVSEATNGRGPLEHLKRTNLKIIKNAISMFSNRRDNSSGMSNFAHEIGKACELAALEKRRQQESLVQRPHLPYLMQETGEDSLIHPFHDNRWRLWTGDARSLETMQPFAHMRFTLCEAKYSEAVAVSCNSHILAQIFVNDALIGESPVVPNCGPPSSVWNFTLSLGIHSPLSLIRVSVMERALFGNDTMIGFTEFRVAELEPDGPEISGWLELRKPDKFKGTARSRFREHRQTRDDGMIVDTTVHGSQQHTSCGSTCMEPRRWSNFGRRPSRTSTEQTVQDTTRRSNAGELKIMMKLVTACGQLSKPARHGHHHDKSDRHPSWLYIILSAVFPSRLRYLSLPDEWHAHCFPRPKCDRVQRDSEDGWLCVTDLKDLHDDLVDVKDIFFDQFVRKIAALFLYVFYWRCRQLSIAVLLHWWLCCIFPVCFLPSLPLWLAFWLRLLRDPRWRQDLLVHEATAPLNEEGFRMVAAFNSSDRMVIWLQRLVDNRGGKVKVAQELSEFAKLTFRDGQPALLFQVLIDELKQKRWITWNAGSVRRCPKSHVLELWGSGSYQQEHLWCCQSQSRDCLALRRARLGLHLGVRRYHCPICQTDFCKSCAAGEKEASMLSMVRVPVLGFEAIKEVVCDGQELAKLVRHVLVTACQFIESLLQQDGSAWTVYGTSLLAAFVFAGFTIIWGDRAAQACRLICQIGCLLAGTTVFTQNATWARRLATVCRANWEFLAAKSRRERGGCRCWAFFTDTDPRRASPERYLSDQVLLGKSSRWFCLRKLRTV